jgi:hypothetical protein
VILAMKLSLSPTNHHIIEPVNMEGSTSHNAESSKRRELDDERRRDDREKPSGSGRRREDEREKSRRERDRDDYRSGDRSRRDDNRDGRDSERPRSDRRNDDRRRERRPSPVGREGDKERQSEEKDERTRVDDRDRDNVERRRERDYDNDRRGSRRDDDRRRRPSRSPPAGRNRRDNDRSSDRRDTREARDGECTCLTSLPDVCSSDRQSMRCSLDGPSRTTGAHGLPPLQTDEPAQKSEVKQFVPPTKESILADRAKAAEAAPAKRPMRLIEVIANDRLGGKGESTSQLLMLFHSRVSHADTSQIRMNIILSSC